MMIHQHDAAVRELRAKREMQRVLGPGRERPRDGDTVHLVRGHVGEAEARSDRLLRQLTGPCPPGDFFLLYGAGQFAILQHCGCGIAQDAADSQDDHARVVPFCAFSILAQVSRNCTVRLNTSFSAVESGSTQK